MLVLTEPGLGLVRFLLQDAHLVDFFEVGPDEGHLVNNCDVVQDRVQVCIVRYFDFFKVLCHKDVIRCKMPVARAMKMKLLDRHDALFGELGDLLLINLEIFREI